jgi:nucleoside-diphosphate-sugar epimerase
VDVFVAGGTGAVGGHAVRALVGAGHRVVAIARTPAKAAQLERAGATPISLSLFDVAGLTEAFAGVQAVCNLASAIPPMSKFMSRRAWAVNDEVRTRGSAAVAKAAATAGVGRLVQESVVMIYRDHGRSWIDEHGPVDGYPMALPNLAAEANANRFGNHGGVSVVLRFGWFYGPGAAHSEQLLAFARRGVCVQMGHADTYVSSIHMVDAGAAVVAALDAPAGVYNVVDDEPLTKRSYADALAAAVGRRRFVRYPGRLALLLGDRSTSLTRSVRASNERFRSTTGWQPRFPSAREGWRAFAREPRG